MGLWDQNQTLPWEDTKVKLIESCKSDIHEKVRVKAPDPKFSSNASTQQKTKQVRNILLEEFKDKMNSVLFTFLLVANHRKYNLNKITER